MAYLPALGSGFVWNDIDYVTKPELRSLGGLWRIWTWPFLEGWDILIAPTGTRGGLGITEQYYPLLHSFFWLQHKLWGDSAAGYHVVNVLLHATAACLLGAVVRRLLVGDRRLKIGDRASAPDLPSPDSDFRASSAAWLAAGLYALHPVMVESVAWISEQKNTLSTVFYLWAALVYLRFDLRYVGAPLATPAPGSPAWWSDRTYLYATFLFLCAAFSKSLTATLPFALLVVFWWKRGRLERRDFMPLIPWMAVFVLIGLVTGRVEQNFVGAQGADFGLSLLERFLLAGHVVWFYLAKLAWPLDLIFIYPRWQVSTSDVSQWLYPIGVIALAACLFALRARTRAPLAAFLVFLGTLFPTSGFFNVYAFKFSYVADHWVYLPAIAVIVLAAAGLSSCRGAARGARIPDAKKRPGVASGAPTWPAVAAAVVLALFGAKTFAQTRGYRDMETFYRTILARNPDSWLALNNLGKFLLETRRLSEAIPYFEQTIKLRPRDAEPHNGLAVAYQQLGREPEALAQFQEAIRLLPNYAEAHYNLGGLLYQRQVFPEAAEEFRAALKARPRYAGAHHNLGAALARLGKHEEAIVEFNEALKSQPVYPLAHSNLGFSYLALGRNREAAGEYEIAIEEGLVNPDVFLNHGTALANLGQYDDAIARFQAVLRMDPTSAEARSRLAAAQQRAGSRPPANPNDPNRLNFPRQ